MKKTLTINADKRYYLYSKMIDGSLDLVNSISAFNSSKIDRYNQLYDEQILGIPNGGRKESYVVDMQRKYDIGSYYNSAINSAASGALSSQKELHRMYKKQYARDIKTRETKIKSEEKKLSNDKALKESIRTYAMTGKWKKPYKNFNAKVAGNNIILFGKKVSIDEYERIVEKRIRWRKNKCKQLKFGLNRAKEKLKKLSIKRIIFGSKAEYRKKDADGINMETWKEDFYLKRHSSMSLPGRKDSKDCNYLVKYDQKKEDLIVQCINGKTAVFHQFRLSRMHDEFLNLLNRKKCDRISVCYNFKLKQDRDGRLYLIPSITMKLEDPHVNDSMVDGVVAIDINWDNISLSELDKDGGLVHTEMIKFQLEGKSSGQVRNIIGRAMDKVGKYCAEAKKPLVMEDISLASSNGSYRYGSRKRNRHISMFAYSQMAMSATSAGLRYHFDVLKINPAYTSYIAKVMYMRKYGLPVHQLASYVIGLKAMDKLPDVPDALKSLFPKKSTPSWKLLKTKLNLRTHEFYKDVLGIAEMKDVTSFTKLKNKLKEVYQADVLIAS